MKGLVRMIPAALVFMSFLPLAAQKADTRVQLLLDKIGQTYTVTDNGDYQIDLDQDGGGTQSVYVGSVTEKYDSIEIREVWSNAGNFPEAPDQATLVDLMTESGSNKIGCWALEKQQDGTYLLYYTIKLPASFTAADLKMMLDFAATIAYQRKTQLFGNSNS